MIHLPNWSKKRWKIFIFSIISISFIIFFSPLNSTDKTWFKSIDDALLNLPFEPKLPSGLPENVEFERAVVFGEGMDKIIRLFYSKNGESYFEIDASLLEFGFFDTYIVQRIIINQNQGYIGRVFDDKDFIKIVWVDDEISYSIENFSKELSEQEMLEIASSLK
ncbi:hypothetical protein ACJ2A9_16990 [Anaerobacillus sp. MEB173]|uniref:hypothetical protein n=1 Tax=Anaerobacillus sp. MEB173 TaxID=3383345 RepID=UPI003F91E609